MFLPRLSAYDPEVKSEGSIDPLGLVPIADRLSVSLVPGVRERMSHPRYLSLIVAGVALCQEYPADIIAKDGISNPLQIFEWYVVQALVKKFKSNGTLLGLPGSDKTNDAMKRGVPLNAPRYLRVPTVFGFYGVYKTLAREIGLIEGDRLGEPGDKLIRIWEKEQNLQGYYSGLNGPGTLFKSKLKKAIDDGLKAGAVDRNWSWSFFDEIAEKLNPATIGRAEAKIIFEQLKFDKEERRKEIIDGLLLYTEKYTLDKGIDECHFHGFLIKQVRQELKDMLNAIKAYELFSRTLTNAFESILYKLSTQSNKGSLKDLECLESVKYAAQNISMQYLNAFEALHKTKEESAFQKFFGRFDQTYNTNQFVETIISHHSDVQKRKSPFGKTNWVEIFQGDLVILRPNYTRKKSLVTEDINTYVYFYRSASLLSFLKDLRKING
jgi:hypothetical protein